MPKNAQNFLDRNVNTQINVKATQILNHHTAKSPDNENQSHSRTKTIASNIFKSSQSNVRYKTMKSQQFPVVTARPRLGTWSIITSRVEGARFLILQSKRLPVRRTFVAAINCLFGTSHTTRWRKPSKLKKLMPSSLCTAAPPLNKREF